MKTAQDILNYFNENEFMAGYVDEIKVEEYGFSFVFDGYASCAIVEHDGKFYDVQDCCLDPKETRFSPTNPEFFQQFMSFDTLEELVKSSCDSMNPDYYNY